MNPSPTADDQEKDSGIPADLTRDFVVAKCEYFADIGIWPRTCILDSGLWLDNFTSDEQGHALYLLNSFMYFSNELVSEIFAASIRTLSRMMLDPNDTHSTVAEKWKAFLDSVTVTYVTGEEPSPTDSGYAFARRARTLGIPENRILPPDRVCSKIREGLTTPVVFVDDFVGTGNQFLATWNRSYGNPSRSFAELACTTSTPFILCAAFCTEFGMERLGTECRSLIVNPGHLVKHRYNVLAEDSIVWPSHLRPTAREFVRCASERAGIPDTMGTMTNDWRGFGALGLTIALEGSIPDATLPIFHWQQNGWNPLLRMA